VREQAARSPSTAEVRDEGHIRSRGGSRHFRFTCVAQSLRKAQEHRSTQVQSYGAHGGRKRYTDPDPNVQFELTRQENRRKGG
jgi:hypothetical protein